MLLRWLEAEDPALASNTQPSERELLSLPAVQHEPSYLLHRPALKEMPFVNADVGVPSAHPPGAVENPRVAFQSATRFSTAVHFSAELETAGSPQAPAMRFTASGQGPPRAAEFRIGVGDKGDVRYCFLETSSGDAGLDEQARRYLMLFRLPDLGTARLESDALVWGTARIDWGNDIVLPTPTTGNAVP